MMSYYGEALIAASKAEAEWRDAEPPPPKDHSLLQPLLAAAMAAVPLEHRKAFMSRLPS